MSITFSRKNFFLLGGLVAAAGAGLEGDAACLNEPMRTRTIGILLFDDVEELDAIGPWEVLSYWARTHPEDGYAVTTFSRAGGPTRCAKGLSLNAEHSYETLPRPDIVLHPGGKGTRPMLTDAAHLDQVRTWRDHAELMVSVCSGSLVYAAAGLLAGHRATTYWSELDTLPRLDASIEVSREARFVDDGEVITSAGVSAGIDMSLHLVARLSSVERARQVRRGIQYDPAPPV